MHSGPIRGEFGVETQGEITIIELNESSRIPRARYEYFGKVVIRVFGSGDISRSTALGTVGYMSSYLTMTTCGMMLTILLVQHYH